MIEEKNKDIDLNLFIAKLTVPLRHVDPHDEREFDLLYVANH